MRNHYCVDLGSVHMSGSSNGGMLTYSALSQLNDVIASAGINCASPILGFGEVPLDPPVSIIDFHGLQVVIYLPMSQLNIYKIQGDHGGQRLHFVDFIFYVPQWCPAALPFRPNLQLPKHNRADNEATKIKS